VPIFNQIWFSQLILTEVFNIKFEENTSGGSRINTRWFKYDRDYLCVNKPQFAPVIFEPPCTCGYADGQTSMTKQKKGACHDFVNASADELLGVAVGIYVSYS
jgi:hypothetical protein